MEDTTWDEMVANQRIWKASVESRMAEQIAAFETEGAAPREDVGLLVEETTPQPISPEVAEEVVDQAVPGPEDQPTTSSGDNPDPPAKPARKGHTPKVVDPTTD
jgi:hypothetical protein